jgi:hypothetical protein
MRFGKWIAVAAVAGMALACNAERHDAAVNQAVMAKISEDPQLARNSVNVETEHGHVTLTGEVMTEDQRQIAAQRAQEVKGVKAVTNNIQIAVSSPPPSTTAPENPTPPSAESPNMPPSEPGNEPSSDEPDSEKE